MTAAVIRPASIGPGGSTTQAVEGLLHGVRGVLFDIDDTLVDLKSAVSAALRDASQHLLPELDAADWATLGDIFTHETLHYFDRYLAGELSFTEQRLLRARAALGQFGAELPEGEQTTSWLATYARLQPGYVRMFDDVIPVLDALDRLELPFGAVSNNLHAHQRAKLDRAGMQRIAVLVGTDTAAASKPDPAIFLEGVRQLGLSPEETLYVGDNQRLDAEGANAAGLKGVWLNRGAAPSGSYAGPSITSLSQMLPTGSTVNWRSRMPWRFSDKYCLFDGSQPLLFRPIMELRQAIRPAPTASPKPLNSRSTGLEVHTNAVAGQNEGL